MEEKHPKVLICAPTSKAHDYVIDRYIDNVSKFTYPNFDFMLVDTSEEEWTELDEKVKKIHDADVFRIKPSKNVFDTLANARNFLIDQMGINQDYKYMMMIDTDTLPPANCIERLMSYDKDLVGFLNYCGQGDSRKPIVLKDGNFVKHGKRGMSWMNQEEIDSLTGLTKVWATSVGSLLVKREVFASGVRFRNTPYMTVGEDVWFFIEANSAGFDFWLDPYVVVHESRIKPKASSDLINIINAATEKKLTKSEMSSRLKRLEILYANLIMKLKLQGVIKDG